jgi:hypothetical protein
VNDIDDVLLDFARQAETGSATETLERTTSRAMCAMAFGLRWRSRHARHTDHLVARKLNLWRDILPFELEPELMDKPVQHVARRRFEAGELIVPYQTDLCFNLSRRAFHRQLRRHRCIEPRAGRFYPRAFIGGSRGICSEETLPFRVARSSGDMITCDLNNPLADKAIDVSVRILDIWTAPKERNGSCNDVAEMVTTNGPGMQSRWRGEPTDFWHDLPFVASPRNRMRASTRCRASSLTSTAPPLHRSPRCTTGCCRDRAGSSTSWPVGSPISWTTTDSPRSSVWA